MNVFIYNKLETANYNTSIIKPEIYRKNKDDSIKADFAPKLSFYVKPFISGKSKKIVIT